MAMRYYRERQYLPRDGGPVSATQHLTLEEFLARPETEPASEYACGEVFQKPMPTNAHGALQLYIALLIYQFLAHTRLGRVRTEWRCVFGPPGRRRPYIPDVVYASFQRLPPVNATDEPYLRVAPDLAVEILSPDESARRFASKLRFYLLHGVRLVWVVDPLAQTITVYTPGDAEERVLTVEDMLDGGAVLPGFRVPVAEIMAQLRET
jgi:Uma2 family endonuclease